VKKSRDFFGLAKSGKGHGIDGFYRSKPRCESFREKCFLRANYYTETGFCNFAP
jgi:hypothetical protein